MKKSEQKKDRYNTTGFLTLTAWYKSLWQNRPHVSFISGLPIDRFSVSTFAHVLPKGRYKSLKWAESNVVFLTTYEHFLFDHGTEHLREKYVSDMAQKKAYPDWNKLYTLKDQLIKLLSVS